MDSLRSVRQRLRHWRSNPTATRKTPEKPAKSSVPSGIISAQDPSTSQPQITPAVGVDTHGSVPKLETRVTPPPEDKDSIAELSPVSSALEGAHHFMMNQPTLVAATTAYISPQPTRDYAQGKQTLLARISKGSLYNSSARFDAPRCDPDTRIGLIEEITAWITDEERPSGILTMTGSAGSGKSALQQSIAEKCAALNILSASFFFSANDPIRSDVSRLIPTLSYQLGQFNEDMDRFIYQAVEDDPLIFDRSLQAQMETLIVTPFLKSSSRKSPQRLLIDGLDECLGEKAQIEVLRVLHTCLLVRKLPFRIFLSSRPEYPIRTALSDPALLKNIAYPIELANYDATSDIRGYLTRNLKAIGAASMDFRIIEKNGAWPSEEDIEQLVDRSSGQFIYAAVVVKFMKEPRRSPFDRLQDILSWTPGAEQRENPFAALDLLYTNILTVAHTNFQPLDKSDDLSIARMLRKMIFHATWQSQHVRESDLVRESLSGDPFMSQFAIYLSISEFERFIQLQPSEFSYMLCDLHSLINVKTINPPNTQRIIYVAPHHKSFYDFLNDRKRSGRFFIPTHEVMTDLAIHSLEMILRGSDSDLRKGFELEAVDRGLRFEPPTSTAMFFALCEWQFYLTRAIAQHKDMPLSKRLTDYLARFSDAGGWTKVIRVVNSLDPTDPYSHCLDGNSGILRWARDMPELIEVCSAANTDQTKEWKQFFDEMEAVRDCIDRFWKSWPESAGT